MLTSRAAATEIRRQGRCLPMDSNNSAVENYHRQTSREDITDAMEQRETDEASI